MRCFCCLILVLSAFICCVDKAGKADAVAEDENAGLLLQGIWINEEEGEPSFRVDGDSIFFPDTTSMPVRFAVISDTLIMYGVNPVKYPIVRQLENTFEFKNQNGETVRLVKSTDVEADMLFFENKHVATINQGQVIKRDTVVAQDGERYHCYVQVNPTTFKVYKSSYNDEGVEVDNVYYDNSVHVSVFKGAVKLYSHDFRKEEFKGHVPENVISQTVLSDILFHGIDSKGVYYNALLCVPDSPSSYVVKVCISFDGHVSMEV